MTHPTEYGDLVRRLVTWLKKRAEPDSGIDYEGDEVGGRGARVTLFGSDADFIVKHFHSSGASTLASAIEALVAERGKARRIIAACASALPNGAYVSETASLEFMANLPGEITSVCNRLSADNAALREALKEARHEVWNLGLTVGQIAKWPRTYFNRFYIEEWVIRTARIIERWGDPQGAVGVLEVTSSQTKLNKRLDAEVLATRARAALAGGK